jgi:hypothetical protein
MDWIGFASFRLIGLFSGGLLALVALGFVLIYKGTRAINFRHRRVHDARGLFGLHRAQLVEDADVVVGGLFGLAGHHAWWPSWSSALCFGPWRASRWFLC